MNKKIRIIFWVCTITVILCAAWSLIRTLRPSRGKPYERLSVEEASDYMSYEKTYCILDVRSKEEYDRGHVQGALNLPQEEIVAQAEELIPDKSTMVYVYGSDSESSCAAAQKLSDMGYISITETGSYSQWCSLETNEGSADA